MGNSKKHRILHINKMLLEMASGNFFYRLKRTNKNDHLEAVTISLNMLAEEIQNAMLHEGYVNSNDPITDIVQMSFIIDYEGYIELATQKSSTILSALHIDIIGKPLSDFITKSSQIHWNKIWNNINQKDIYDTTLELNFKTKDGLYIPKTCYITTFIDKHKNQRKTLLTAIHRVKNQDKLDHELKKQIIKFSDKNKQENDGLPTPELKPKIRLTFEDIRKIREGHDIIINNLEKPLPTIKEFALQLGTNEFKLKYGFKELYGTSVHKFLMQERLRKSKMMIQYSSEALISIARMTGFKSIAHFSRAFKKHYGYPPSQLRKTPIEAK
ncbi:helix-turn-helix transcriptional regulator [Tamlana sp. I1]|uniref:helix-turn-helix transcriptional regulator n=1 Tax=Tamlana sp. I1 TaxID=2762061 RepID=UPI0018907BD1|nr:AraC family transcriptional regulator [Tamlana sp. I1]